MCSPHNHHNGKQFASAHSSIDRPVFRNDKDVLQENHWLLSTFFSSGVRFICKIELIISSYWGSVTGYFAPGGIPISCHIISCFVWVTLALNREAVPAAAVIRKMFISKWCFFNRNKWHIVITAQLMAAKSFISRFSLRFFSLCKLLIKKKKKRTEDSYNSRLRRQWVCPHSML